jgi:molybdenum cofactor cytidylyltransferase
VTIYGAGGKTILMDVLARELTARKKTAIQTTTTKIFRPEDVPVVIGEDFPEVAGRLTTHIGMDGRVILGTKLLRENKIDGIDPAWPEALLENHVADYVIVEADGAARKPIKGYASYEPVFPTRSDLLIPVLGIEAIGQPVTSDHVHRCDAFRRLTGAPPDGPLAVSHFAGCMMHMIGLGQASSPDTPVVPLINKVDRLSGTGMIQEVAAALSGTDGRILFASLQNDHPVRFVYQGGKGKQGFEFSVVVLAAGGSVRMGRPKLSLRIQGKTLLENALTPIGRTGMKDVVVVFSEENEGLKELIPPGYRVVVNRRSREGISTSLKAGLAAVDPCSQGVLFALGDQPFIGAEVYARLMDHHRRNLPLLTWPTHGGKRGNPVLFDRRLWPQLMQTEGDEGGRRIVTETMEEEIGRVEVEDTGVLIDIDSPEEYERYRTKESSGN